MNKRDEMLILAGMTAADLAQTYAIDIPVMSSERYDSFIKFIVNAVADYIMSGSKDDFLQYIKEVLEEEYGTKGSGS